MRFTLTSLVRLIGFVAVGLSAVAVGLSRAAPKPSGVRAAAAPRFFGVNGAAFYPPVAKNYLLDAETGALVGADFAPDVSLEYASGSPWRDGEGGVAVAGRLTARSGSSHAPLDEGSGLALVHLPDGRVISRVEMEPVVVGRPCWLPGPASRVLFCAADGLLYVQDFPESDAAEAPVGGGLRPRPVAWQCPVPGDGRVLLSDPVCPPVPALGGRVFVSLNRYGRSGDQPKFGASEVWWLSLDREARAVVAAGRLTPPTGPEDDGRPTDERLPNLAAAPDGRVAAAYLVRPRGESPWRLRIAPVAFDGESGVPAVVAAEARDLTDDCAVTVPAFSTDGRWLYHLPRRFRPGEAVGRFPVFGATVAAGPRGMIGG